MLCAREGLVVGAVTESVVHHTYLNALLGFLVEQVDKNPVDGVVAEVEVLHVDETAGGAHVFEQVLKFVVTAFEQIHLVAVCDVNTYRAE